MQLSSKQNGDWTLWTRCTCSQSWRVLFCYRFLHNPNRSKNANLCLTSYWSHTKSPSTPAPGSFQSPGYIPALCIVHTRSSYYKVPVARVGEISGQSCPGSTAAWDLGPFPNPTPLAPPQTQTWKWTYTPMMLNSSTRATDRHAYMQLNTARFPSQK